MKHLLFNNLYHIFVIQNVFFANSLWLMLHWRPPNQCTVQIKSMQN